MRTATCINQLTRYPTAVRGSEKGGNIRYIIRLSPSVEGGKSSGLLLPIRIILQRASIHLRVNNARQDRIYRNVMAPQLFSQR
jgi:hypothetical protein